MTPSQRMQQKLRTTGMLVWQSWSISKSVTEKSMTGAELTACITEAREFYAKLGACIASMERVLDEGETVDEYRARIAAEDADPATAAKAAGWFAIEDFAALCDPGPTGFRKRIDHLRGNIVKPRDEARFQQLIGNGWREYEQRFEFWADHFHHAESWADALKQVRQEEARNG